METSLDLFERMTDIRIDDLFGKSEHLRKAAERALRTRNLPDVSSAIREQHEQLKKPPVYAAGNWRPGFTPLCAKKLWGLSSIRQ